MYYGSVCHKFVVVDINLKFDIGMSKNLISPLQKICKSKNEFGKFSQISITKPLKKNFRQVLISISSGEKKCKGVISGVMMTLSTMMKVTLAYQGQGSLILSSRTYICCQWALA